MQTTNIREKLYQLIDDVDDKKAETIYILLSNETDVDEQRRKLIQNEHEAYLKGEGKSFSWEEVKDMATCKSLSKHKNPQ